MLLLQMWYAVELFLDMYMHEETNHNYYAQIELAFNTIHVSDFLSTFIQRWMIDR